MPIYVQAMSIASAKLLINLLMILSQSSCPSEDCPLGWESDVIVFHDYTAPPVIVQIPHGGGSFIFSIKPRVQAMLEIILSCGWF